MTTDLTQSPLALRPRDAAKALGISERKLWQLTHDGLIPSAKVGRTVLYPVTGLHDWLRQQTEAAKGGDDEPC